MSIERTPTFTNFATLSNVSRKKTKKTDADRPVFDSIRKPTAPPTRKIESDAKSEKLLPSLRKVKHKKSPEAED